MDEFHAFNPALGQLHHGLWVLGGEAVAYDEDIGDQAIGNACVINLLGSGTLGHGVTHVGVPRYSCVYFFLGKEHSRLNAIFSMDSVLEDFILLISAQA